MAVACRSVLFGLLMLLGVGIVTGQSSCGTFSSVSISSALLDAIRCVESNEDVCAVGDNGRSIGAYQIMRSYYNDSVASSYTLRTSGQGM